MGKLFLPNWPNWLNWIEHQTSNLGVTGSSPALGEWWKGKRKEKGKGERERKREKGKGKGERGNGKGERVCLVKVTHMLA